MEQRRLGGDGQTWDVIGNQNWASSAPSDPNRFHQGDNVIFNDSNNGNYNVTLNTSVSPGSITVNTANAYVISGSGTIAGAGSPSITGPGSLTLLNSQ